MSKQPQSIQIEKAENGWYVLPPFDGRTSGVPLRSETLVFETMPALLAYVEQAMTL